VQQEAQKRVDLAFRAFFRRVKAAEPPVRRNGGARKPGYPRFKGRHRYDSFTYPQPKGNFRLLDNGRLRLSKVGDVKIKLHRPVEGKVKTLTIRRDAVGNWYACFSCQVEPTPLPPTDRMTGVDAGLTHFATLSTGEHIPNPRFFRQDEKALAKAQRRLSACEKGTPEYRKLIRVVQHIHKRIANRRRDFAHKVSRRLVNEFQFIALEDLDIQDMQNGNHRGMNKSIADVAWGQLGRYTSFKAEEAGRTVVRVDPRGTTQECSGCGEIVHKDLSVRVHHCPHCGLVLDRDENAALNILARGLACVGSIPRSSLL
jgi:putative transposase